MPRACAKSAKRSSSADCARRKQEKVRTMRRAPRHDPMARPTLERQIGGEEIKVAQPRINRKKKMKGRIYQKLKKGQIEEGEVGDGVEDMAEDKVSARR